jgi:hypothetical protein
LTAAAYNNCCACDRYSTNAGDKCGGLRSCRADADFFGLASNPTLPISMLLLPVVRLKPALKPNAMLLLPVVFLLSALLPSAVLLLPIVLL